MKMTKHNTFPKKNLELSVFAVKHNKKTLKCYFQYRLYFLNIDLSFTLLAFLKNTII